MRIAYIITDLDVGGAEVGLSRLIRSLQVQETRTAVFSLSTLGPVSESIRDSGAQLYALGLSNSRPDLRKLFQLAGWLKAFQPDIIHTWMYHADLFGSIAARLGGRWPIIWGIRNSTLDAHTSKRSTRLLVRLLSLLSGSLPAAIVSVSEAARQVHIEKGYATGKLSVIPNGFDLNVFKPDPAAYLAVRQELNLPANTRLVGLMARFDPQKDHANFLQAACQVRQRCPDAHFLLCGAGVDPANEALLKVVHSNGLSEAVHLLGRRADMPRLNAALDIAVTSSAYGEAFPQVVGEAMACGVPCAVTDVGDSALIVAATGRAVPPRDAARLAGAICELLALSGAERKALGEKARQRIETHYSLESVSQRYLQLYRQVTQKPV